MQQAYHHRPMEHLSALTQEAELWIKQRKELAELIGFESRNKYEIANAAGQPLAYAAEQSKGALAMISRQLLGHWRTFEITIFDASRNPLLKVVHPHRWIFQRIEIADIKTNQQLGAVQQRFAVFSKRFDVEDPQGRVLLTVSSPIWKIWTFQFERNGQPVALVQKKWGGLIKEALTDADKFRVGFTDTSLDAATRILILAAALFIDLQYFEKKAGE